MGERIAVQHPLLEELRRADNEAARRFPSDYDPGLGDLGLIMHKTLTPRCYDWCTPLNAWAFASTGGNGVHFSLLAREEAIREDSPVIVTNPGATGGSWVVGENLFDFLCLGSHRGYFALEQLEINMELTQRVYTDPAWQPSEQWHYSVGYHAGEHQRQLLEFLRKKFDLRPWADAKRFAELEGRFWEELEMPPDSERWS